ncbi:hypothetical protein [Hyphomicrobium sp. LHD-15]|uniref:hypothetical protein n=1 Tax=Hyphomicrobium sp. LHD-15 TaxID=3072142 RepID=UPI00280EBFF9|nr:hypothetical protein [Hyphomicrobium sp. LHD-15]MDQ8697652.1 hypothetical protein [Hyphomicrobium sp. LHD-15]
MRLDSEIKSEINPEWAALMASGFGGLARGETAQAASQWQRAFDTMFPASESDARLAAGHSNVGAGLLLLGQRRDADAAFERAEQAWLETIAALPTLDFPVVGLSSSFHFRLASRNLPAFQEARRKRYAELCEACLAITRFHRLLTHARSPAPRVVESSARTLTDLLSETFGPRCVDVRLLESRFVATVDGDIGLSLYADKVSEFASRQAALSALLPEACRDLETATALVALILPTPSLGTGNSAEAQHIPFPSRPAVSSHE